MLVDKSKGIGLHLAAHVEQVVIVLLHLCSLEAEVWCEGEFSIGKENLIIRPMNGICRQVIFLYQFQVVGHEGALCRAVHVFSTKCELALFDIAMSYIHRIGGVGLADDSHGIAVGKIHLAINNKAPLLGIESLRAQEKGYDIKEYLHKRMSLFSLAIDYLFAVEDIDTLLLKSLNTAAVDGVDTLLAACDWLNYRRSSNAR